MFLTEEKAKEKWCPFSRYAIFSKRGVSAAANRLGDDRGLGLNPEQCRCIASDCMAWRWLAGELHGYCGNAGHPKLMFAVQS